MILQYLTKIVAKLRQYQLEKSKENPEELLSVYFEYYYIFEPTTKKYFIRYLMNTYIR